MPSRATKLDDIGTAKAASDSYDVENIFLSDEGWVYRHYKTSDKSKFWDEIIVAGEVDSTLTIDGVANTPVDAVAAGSPTFESVAGDGAGDTKQDIEYSADFSASAPTPPATGPAASVSLVGTTSTESDGSITATATTSSNGSGLTVTYDVTSNVASNLAIAVAGSGYQAGDSFTVAGDTGVTGTVAI